MKQPPTAAPADVELSPADILRLHEHLLDLGATLNLDRLHLEILQTCVVLMSADKGNVQVLNPATGMLTIAAQIGFTPEFLRTFVALDPADDNHSICTRAVARRRRIFSFDVINDEDFPVVRESAMNAGFRSVQSTPIFSSTGRLLVVVSTHWAEPHRPTAHQEAAMDAFLRQAAHFLERRVADDLREEVLAHEQSARRVAEDLNRGKDRFIATVVHELRQPLAPMVAALEVMKLRVSRESGERARQIVERQIAQLVRLIEDLLDVARINEGKARLRTDRVDLRELVKDAIEAIDPGTRTKRQTVGLIAPDIEVWVSVDAVRIRQVFANLLSNASKFSAEDSSINVTIGFEDADVRVDIQDQGRGIAADVLPHIFEAFRQSTNGESGGLGVGLSIVRGLVELHGGTVEARSAGLGRGSTFAVRLARSGGILKRRAGA